MGTVEMDSCGIPMALIREAKKDPLIGPRIVLSSKRREPLVWEGEVVGFVTPHDTPSGRRIGPIYVAPGHRKRGLVLRWYNEHPDETFIAFIPVGNYSSLRLHQRAGFRHWKNARNGEWLRREPLK